VRRRDFIACVTCAAAAPHAARAQQQPMPVIGYLGLSDAGLPSMVGFRQGLNETGYVDGRNIAVEYRWAEGNPERFPALAAELVALNVDVIVTGEAHSPPWPPCGQRRPSPSSSLLLAIR